MEKRCQSCGKAFIAGQGNFKYCPECKTKMTPPAVNSTFVVVKDNGELSKVNGAAIENRVAEQIKKATISKMGTVGAKNAHTEEVVVSKKEIATDENVDMVNHPPHYQLANGMETIDIIEALLTSEEFIGWLKGNSLKYQFRAGKKDPTKLVEDYEKADFQINRLTKKLKELGK